MVPPPLAWIPSFAASVQHATGSTITYDIQKTVNPLVLRVTIGFQERVSGKSVMLVWNLFQMFAASNDCIMKGKKMDAGHQLVAEIVTKQRLGIPRNTHPVG
jgi:hypothetical protein